MTDVRTTHNPDQNRYEAQVGDELAGTAEYELNDDLVIFTHTVVDDAYEGQGVGSALARFALDDVKASGSRQVEPRCAFIKGWIDKHPDYASLVADSA